MTFTASVRSTWQSLESSQQSFCTHVDIPTDGKPFELVTMNITHIRDTLEIRRGEISLGSQSRKELYARPRSTLSAYSCYSTELALDGSEQTGALLCSLSSSSLP